MKIIRVYGDSYVAPLPPQEGKGWTKILADRLGMEELNFGVGGSSAFYTIKKLALDLKNNEIKEDSLIIVLLSSLGRFYNKTSLEKFPSSGTNFIHESVPAFDANVGFTEERPVSIPNGVLLSAKSEMARYYYENENFIKWWFVENDIQLENINVESFIHWIYLLAVKKHTNHKFIIMFNSSYKHDYSCIENTKNFILLKDFFMSKIANNEIDEQIISTDLPRQGKYFRLTEHIDFMDPRINHLTKPNIEILVEQMEKVVLHNDCSGLRHDAFLSNVIKPIRGIEEYNQYVVDNILYERPQIARLIARKFIARLIARKFNEQ
jgi:hypothetical protein